MEIKSTAVNKTAIFFILGDEIPSPVYKVKKTLIFDYFDCHANSVNHKISCRFCVGIELCGRTLPFVVRFVYSLLKWRQKTRPDKADCQNAF